MNRNIILIDADHLDFVAFDLIVNFERMLGRRIPTADLAQWLNYIALDGGLRAGENDIQVCFIHSKERESLQHFTPSHFANELHDKAFKDEIGEFTLAAFSVEPIVSREDFYVQSFEAILLDRNVERVMLIGDFEGINEENRSLFTRIKNLCANPPKPEDGSEPLPPKDITLFSMQPLSGRGFQQEILGYSLTAAMGVKAQDFQ